MNTPKAGAVVFCKDVVHVARFYENVLSMSVQQAEPGLIVLESEILQLVLHDIPPAIADTITITTPPQIREDTALKLFFPVPSLVRAREVAANFGGGVQPPAQEWSAADFRACDGFDPEGNVVQFRESAS